MNYNAKLVKIKNDRRNKYDDNFLDDFLLDVTKPLRALHTRGYYYICVDAEWDDIDLRDAVRRNNYEQIHETDVDILEEGELLSEITFL